jgi:hypothetical protein
MPYIRPGKALRLATLPLLALTLTLTLSEGTFAAAPQAAPTPQQTDGEAPTQVGSGSQAFKQQTDGEAPIQVGPGSQAYDAAQAAQTSR